MKLKPPEFAPSYRAAYSLVEVMVFLSLANKVQTEAFTEYMKIMGLVPVKVDYAERTGLLELVVREKE